MFHDRLREFREAIDGDFVVLVEAEQFHKLMERDHPDELAEWQTAKTVEFIADALGTIIRSERAKARTRAGARAFQEAAEELAAAGGPENPDALDSFAQVYKVNKNNLFRSVADMTGADHRFVADQYEATGKRALMLTSFHRAVAKKVGTRRTGDVFEMAEYDRLLGSFLNPKARGGQAA
jgi:hypothetical protein